MNDVVKRMLNAYDLTTVASAADALREVVQEIALLGLSRSAFFTKAAFYGGTALRIFYGLDRYSEDMDFSLLETDGSFNLSDYEDFVVNELRAFGFDVAFEKREKSRETQIESAFLKMNTKVHFLVVEGAEKLAARLPKGQTIQIKIEVDTDPPPEFATEVRYHLLPIPFSAQVYVMPDLFAGKMHALLCRGWKARVKGRDWYDFVWYVAHDTPLHLAHLEARMLQSGHRDWSGSLSPDKFRTLLRERIETLDVRAAQEDVRRFLPDPGSISIWSKEFFFAIADKVRFTG